MAQTQDNRQHIVVVDDNPVNLDLAESLLKSTYKVTKLISGEQLLKFLTRVKPDMILLDIQMPILNGFETLQEIKKNSQWDNIPVIFITGQKDTDSEREGFRLGAKDFIAKPFDHLVMLARIRSHMDLHEYSTRLEEVIKRKTQEVEELQNVITISWAEVIESRDGTTGSHVRNTTRYFEAFLKILCGMPDYKNLFTPDTIADLLKASTLHDIGKIGISDLVLKKPGPLNEEEYTYMKMHSKIGANIIQKIMDYTKTDNFLVYAKNMALSHHEKWDGTGYPNGLKGTEIPIYVSILSIVDVFEALTSVRPYKKAFDYNSSIDIMRKERGKFFVPDLLDIFQKHDSIMKELLTNKSE